MVEHAAMVEGGRGGRSGGARAAVVESPMSWIHAEFGGPTHEGAREPAVVEGGREPAVVEPTPLSWESLPSQIHA